MLHFVDSFYKEFSVQISQFTETFRIFPTISLNTGNFDIAAHNFWWDYGLNIEEIYFRNGILRKQEFEEIIRWTPNLKVLKIESNSIFKTWQIKGNYHERVFQFENCYQIDLSGCLSKMSGRERTQILDHFIFYLKGYGSTIKSINLHSTLTDDFFLQQLAEVKII